MSRIFYHSDWHLNHEFVAKTRNFDTADAHDEWLIDNINSTVTKRDHLWMLGDLTLGSLTAALDKVRLINGVKHLVFGNHDAGHPMHKGSHNKLRRYLEVFDSVHLHEQHIINGNRVLLSHFPYDGDHYDADRYTQWRLRDEGNWLICGHVHNAWAGSGKQINVGVDRNPRPVTSNHLADLMSDRG